MSQDPNACFVWVVPTGDDEKFRVFRSHDSSLEFSQSVADQSLVEPLDSTHWQKCAGSILQYIQDYNNEEDIEHVWVIVNSKPFGPLGVYLSEENAKKSLVKWKENIEKSATIEKFSVTN